MSQLHLVTSEGRVEIDSNDPRYDKLQLRLSPEGMKECEDLERSRALGSLRLTQILVGDPLVADIGLYGHAGTA